MIDRSAYMIIFLKPKLPLDKEKEIRQLLVGKKIDVIPVVRESQILLVVVGRFGELAKREIQKDRKSVV